MTRFAVEYVRVAVEDDLLAGSQSGRRFRQHVLEATTPLSEPFVVLVDFDHGSPATGSWLREAILLLREQVQAQEPSGSIALANCSDELLEELELFATHTDNCFTVADLKDNHPTAARIVGVLEPALRDSFERLKLRGEVSGSELAVEYPEVSAPAWNNRLNALFSRGLILTTRPGRARLYQLLFPGAIYDGL